MAPTFHAVQHTVGTGGANHVDAAMPTNSVGDLMLAFFFFSGFGADNSVMTPPAGWTTLIENVGTANTLFVHCGIAYKVSAGESGTKTFTTDLNTTSGLPDILVASYAGAGVPTVFGKVQTGGFDTTVPTPAITSLTDGDLDVRVAFLGPGTAAETDPAGYTHRATVGPDFNVCTSMLADKAQAAHGTYAIAAFGGYNNSNSRTRWGYSIAIPAGSAGGGGGGQAPTPGPAWGNYFFS